MPYFITTVLYMSVDPLKYSTSRGFPLSQNTALGMLNTYSRSTSWVKE